MAAAKLIIERVSMGYGSRRLGRTTVLDAIDLSLAVRYEQRSPSGVLEERGRLDRDRRRHGRITRGRVVGPAEPVPQ